MIIFLKNKIVVSIHILVVALLLTASMSMAQTQLFKPPFQPYLNHSWVDSVMQTLSLEQQINQLFMIPVYSNRDAEYEAKLIHDIKEWQVGGIINMQGGPVRQVQLTNALQSVSNVPMMVSMDAEWGPKMRLDSVLRYPYQMTLGAIQNDSLIIAAGQSMATQLKRLGVQVSFSPDADVNNNPNNPVINFRSFGEQPGQVAWKAFLLGEGIQSENVLAVAKHFPGHGDTYVDSHLDLPVVSHPLSRLMSVELYPFVSLTKNGVGGIMTAHLNVPALDSTGTPASLSPLISDSLLQQTLGYEGLIFTDALNMKGATKGKEKGEIEIEALEAGNDVLLFTEDVPLAQRRILEAIKSGRLSKARIARSCRKILATKYWTGLGQYRPALAKGAYEDLNKELDAFLIEELSRHSITCLQNANIPILNVQQNIAVISIGNEEADVFAETLNKYTHVARFFLPANASSAEKASLLDTLKTFDVKIWALHNLNVYPKNNFGVPTEMLQWLNKQQDSQSIFTLFGNPYILKQLPDIHRAGGVLLTYQETEVMQSFAAQVIFGALSAEGRLPVSVGNLFTAGDGVTTTNLGRMSYRSGLAVGIETSYFAKIAEKAEEAIRQGATPGCQIVAVKDGVVFYQKSFGYHTYDSLRAVKNTDLYDIASLTKVSGALPALMKLYGEQKINLDATFGTYLPYFKKGELEDVTLRAALAHQAGLYPWIPFWKEAKKKNGHYKWFTFKSDSSRRFPYKVADNLYAHRHFTKRVFKAIRKKELGDKVYKYSGLSFYLYPQMIQCLTDTPYLTYLNEQFYGPLGAYRLTYEPNKRFDLDDIVPTEYDSLFRKQQLHGTVHDEGAAVMHKMSSNAGLFASANDLAKLMQMYEQQGYYGGKQYINAEALKEFTSCQYCETGNRRGLGFDRPLEEPKRTGNTAIGVSQKSFGHSGFTGTFAWVDPQYDFVYVFLSNRVYPTRENSKLFQLNTRTDIQQLFYESFKSGVEQEKKKSN